MHPPGTTFASLPPSSMEEVRRGRFEHLTRWRIIAIVFLLFIFYGLYRVFFVYTVRSGNCDFVRDRDVPRVVGTIGGRRITFPPHPAGGRPLLVMSYNIEGHAVVWRRTHVEQIAAVINRVRPDIVGLQEVHRGTLESRFADQAAEIARLTGMKMVYGKAYSPGRGEFGNAMLTRGTIVRSRLFTLPSIGEPRALLESTVSVDGETVEVFVTHLATWEKLNRHSRGEQLDCISEHLRDSRLPYILIGDFNAAPDAAEIRHFTESDVVAPATDARETHRFMHEKIDYILTDPGWQVRRVDIPHIGPSDHYPLIELLDPTPPLQRGSTP